MGQNKREALFRHLKVCDASSRDDKYTEYGSNYLDGIIIINE